MSFCFVLFFFFIQFILNVKVSKRSIRGTMRHGTHWSSCWMVTVMRTSFAFSIVIKRSVQRMWWICTMKINWVLPIQWYWRIWPSTRVLCRRSMWSGHKTDEWTDDQSKHHRRITSLLLIEHFLWFGNHFYWLINNANEWLFDMNWIWFFSCFLFSSLSIICESFILCYLEIGFSTFLWRSHQTYICMRWYNSNQLYF